MAKVAKSKTLRIEEEPCIWLDSKDRYAWEVLRQYEDGSRFRKGGACTTLEAAVIKRDAAIALFEGGQLASRYTVRAWAKHCVDVLWKDEADNGEIKADTVLNHASILANHIVAMFGDMWLDAVTLEHVKRLNQKLVGMGRDEDTRANIRNTGSKLYSTAIQHEVVTANPFKALRINRSKAKRSEETGHKLEHKRILTQAEQDELLSWAEAHWACGMVLAALYLGLRKAEITGMTWRNVLWDRNEYYVEEQVRRSRTLKTMAVEDLKSTPSERTLPIHPRLMAWLRDEFAKPDRHAVKVFANTKGSWISPEDMDEAIDDLRMIAGTTNKVDERGTPLPDCGWHDLRHTFATRLATAVPPVAPRTLMELMGHSEISTTFGYYVSTSFADKRAAIMLL